jgi:Flp pilus assembly protein TadG
MRTSRLDIPTRRRRVSLREEAGAALVEFALIIPVLALMLFGALDIGKAYNYWIDATHLANEGARFAAVNRNPDPAAPTFLAAIKADADTAELRNGGTTSVPNPLQVCVYLPDGAVVGGRVRVEVSSTYQFLSFIASKINLASKTVVADSTMRLERVPTTYADGDCA